MWIERLEAVRGLLPAGDGTAGLASLFRDAAIGGRPLRELAVFVAIGGGAALSFVVLSSWLVAALPALPGWLVSACCYGLFIGPVYLLHRRYTFHSDARHAEALPRYVAVQLSALLLAALFSYLCYAVLGVRSWIAGLLVIGLTSGMNFAVLKIWAFARR